MGYGIITMSDLQGLNFSPPAMENKSGTEIASSRAEHEVQAAFVIAKKFPRNENEAYAKIINACKRPTLAEQAMYAYPKGGTLVNGPSIRLAEALAQNWGNIQFGIKEVSQANGISTVEAFAIDLETNSRKEVTFYVKHERHTKKGVTKLTDPRDIYELIANQGARRLRACILAILPGDVVESSVDQCKKTLESSDVPIADQVRKMVLAFDELGVKVEHLEKRLGHKLDAVIPTEIVTLKTVYKSIKDGFAHREDFFDFGAKTGNAEAYLDTLVAQKKQKIDPKTGEINAKG
jgi:hypothetical protein